MARPSSARPSSSKSSTLRLANPSTPTPRPKDFILTEKLGSGTYATVYKAYRKDGPRAVAAIKCVLKSSLNKASTENLLTEIELLKKLNHENIVELKDFQWDDNYIYLIMEYSSGGDLSNFIKSKRCMPEHVVRKFLRQIVAAMKYLHEHNVAHMDLKPQNILCTSAEMPVLKIADFGFAKHMFQGDRLHALRGSPLYMAPEIICKGQYDARVDLWSIGVILYECLFGRPPYASRSFKELEEKIWDPKPVELPYGVNVSDKCRDLLLRLLTRDPNKRISFEEFFTHPFLDLKHAPSSTSLPKAKQLIQDAVTADTAGNYTSAVKLYCEAVEFFIPAIKYEKEESKKNQLRNKVKEYISRAEELKSKLKPHKHTNAQIDGVIQRSESTDSRSELLELFSGCDEIVAAIKVVQAAVTEEENDEYEQALQHYELALGPAISILKTEPKGRRRDLLRENVEKWMAKAEDIKKYLEVKNTTNNNSMEAEQQEEAAEKSILNAAQCVIQ